MVTTISLGKVSEFTIYLVSSNPTMRHKTSKSVGGSDKTCVLEEMQMLDSNGGTGSLQPSWSLHCCIPKTFPELSGPKTSLKK